MKYQTICISAYERHVLHHFKQMLNWYVNFTMRNNKIESNPVKQSNLSPKPPHDKVNINDDYKWGGKKNGIHHKRQI